MCVIFVISFFNKFVGDELNMELEEIKKAPLLRKQIFNSLKEAIIKGEFKPGERIIEVELAKKLKVSRTPLREALRLLESKGYLEPAENGGVRVAKISKEEVKEWSEIRNVLNVLAIKKAVDNITDEELDKLRRILIKMKNAINEDDETKLSLANSEFHSIIFKASKNSLIISIGKEYQNYTFLLRNYLAHMEDRRRKAYNEHKEILKSLEERNKKKAIEVMKKHSYKMHEAMIDYIGDDN